MIALISIIPITIIILIAFGLTALALPIADRGRRLAHQVAIDVVEIVARWQAAQIDGEARRAKIEAETERAQVEIEARRLALLAGPEVDR